MGCQWYEWNLATRIGPTLSDIGAMLRNFLEALQITGAIKSLKRIVLVTGAKQYGLQFGRTKNPMVESDPRIDDPGRPPNFYYYQQDILKEMAASASWDWVVTYANDVIGFASNNFMNLTTTLGLYAAVSKEMGGELTWPGGETFYHAATSFTDSKLHAAFCLWAALEPKCGNQTFNVVNGDVESWQSLWPKVAARFGCTVPKDQLSRKLDPSLSTLQDLSDKPPIMLQASSMGLEGSSLLKPSTLEGRIDVTKWSQREDVKAAWMRLAKRKVLDEDVFARAPWGFLLFVLGRDYDIIISMSKAREYGWTGYKDTWTAFDEVFSELESAGMLPKRV